jgi:phosphatidylserine decarboxylase
MQCAKVEEAIHNDESESRGSKGDIVDIYLAICNTHVYAPREKFKLSEC